MKTVLILAALAVAAVHALPHPEYIITQDDTGRLMMEHTVEGQEHAPENFFDAVTDTRFWLYTGNSAEPEEIFGTEASITGSSFNAANPTRVLIHGHNGGINSEVNTMIRAAYQTKGAYNVIVVDWSAGASTTLFQTARNRVGAVGGAVAYFLMYLSRFGNNDPANTYLIGHNLGAHIAGITGKNYDADRIPRFAAIVALDASLNLFSMDLPNERVAIGDALYLETIHTNTGQNGFDQPIGDASFYPAFGNRQPGCGIDVTGNCSHLRAVEYFAESINTTTHFWSRQCEAYLDILMERCIAAGVDRKMGSEPVDTLARGIYWCSTNNASPFATGIL